METEGNFHPRFEGDKIVIVCARCHREVERRDIFGVLDDIRSQRRYSCPDCDTSKPALETITEICHRCRFKELDPPGKGKRRTFGGQDMFLCDRCWAEVFGGKE